MGIFKRLTLDYRKSIYTKVLLSILIALMVIIFLMEMSNFLCAQTVPAAGGRNVSEFPGTVQRILGG